MTKGERISRFVQELEGGAPDADAENVAEHPCYRGFFRCWNEQRYYEAHDVLEHLWLETKSEDAQYFKGLIQAAGAFVHLQKNFEHPEHAKHSRRLAPAVRLFRLAEANLAPFAPIRHRFDLAEFLRMLASFREAVSDREPKHNPWSPATAPKLSLGR
ncbi:MAG: DUF309 domain-containing protein [Verrucomicrobiota bacterium]|nr:DUF309 domain-containing protein [Verrucomicrobiota bacterium]